jgi:proteasome lid subunit RPN8/RPN11
LDKELDVWQAGDGAVRIAYSRAVMEDLRLAVVDGFHRLAHGGVEIGGVLFGVRDNDTVKVLAHRELTCEYVFGPSFTLSENDCQALEKILVSTNNDSQLSGMQPVGWYQSHTRSEILLSEEELRFYKQHFPEPWQIALLLRPHRFDPVRAGFFYREADGSVHSASSRHEFEIEPVATRPVIRVPEDRMTADRQPPTPASTPEPQQEQQAPPPPAAPAVSRNPRGRWAWIAAVIAVALAGILFWNVRSHAAADLSLRALDVGGQLRIDWNHGARVIQQGQSGAIEIEDGTFKVHNELSQEDLRSGSVTYLRTTGHVQVSLMVRGVDQGTQTEILRFSGPPVPTASAVSQPPRSEQKAEPLEPVTRPSSQTVGTAAAIVTKSPAPEASAPARRLLVLPRPGVPHVAEPLLPAPPAIAVETAPALTAFIPKLPGPAPLKPAPADQGLAAGKIIWTGKLGRSGTIQILGNHASQGHMIGALPGTPVRVHVFPSEMTQDGVRMFAADPKSIGAPEAPGAQNGWNRTVYVLNPKKAGEVSIVEAPGQHNQWNKLILRAERGDHAIIVLHWERLPAEPALAAAGNQ